MSSPNPCVLLVDDTEANLIAFEAVLANMGCDFVRATNGNDALKQLLKREFALMLLDVQMPEMDGYEVARYSREHPATREVPIIFVTGMHETEENLLRGYGTGAVDLLFKPVNSRILRSKVQVFLDLYLGRRKLAAEIEAHEKTLAELRLANAALRHFTHAASHDLKAPVRAMRGFLDALAEEAGDKLDAQALHYLERSRQAGVRMDSLLDSLLAYARLQKPVSWVDVDCEALLAQVRIDIADRLAATSAVLEVGTLPSVRADADRLYQLFVNLVLNAIKFRRPGQSPKVTVSAKTTSRGATFCVEDDGIGIARDRRDEVFQAFRRLRATAEYEGSGLGLTICQQIVEQHGGRIWIESEEGHGSKFFFTLPLAPAPPGL